MNPWVDRVVSLGILQARELPQLKNLTIPRHREINDFLAQKICKDPDVPKP